MATEEPKRDPLTDTPVMDAEGTQPFTAEDVAAHVPPKGRFTPGKAPVSPAAPDFRFVEEHATVETVESRAASGGVPPKDAYQAYLAGEGASGTRKKGGLTAGQWVGVGLGGVVLLGAAAAGGSALSNDGGTPTANPSSPRPSNEVVLPEIPKSSATKAIESGAAVPIPSQSATSSKAPAQAQPTPNQTSEAPKAPKVQPPKFGAEDAFAELPSGDIWVGVGKDGGVRVYSWNGEKLVANGSSARVQDGVVVSDDRIVRDRTEDRFRVAYTGKLAVNEDGIPTGNPNFYKFATEGDDVVIKTFTLNKANDEVFHDTLNVTAAMSAGKFAPVSFDASGKEVSPILAIAPADLTAGASISF